MVRSRKPPQNAIDRALDALDADSAADFRALAATRAAYSDLQQFLRERGQDVSLSSCQTWFLANFPVGEEARLINELATNYAGVEPSAVMGIAIGAAVRLVNALTHELTPDRVRNASTESLLHQLGVYIKEARVAAVAAQEWQTLKDRKALELAGGYRVAELARAAARDLPQGQVLEELLAAALTQLEREVGGNAR